MGCSGESVGTPRQTRDSRITRRRWIALAFLAVVGAWGCSSAGDRAGRVSDRAAETTVATGETLRMAMPTAKIVLDPAAAVPTRQEDMILLDLVYDTLTRFDHRNKRVTPALARRWHASDGFKTWTFELAPDARFHDGTPVRPEDVKKSLERLAASRVSLLGARLEVLDGYSDFVAGRAGEIRGIESVGDSQVVFHTRAPYAPLPELLSAPSFGVVPAAGFVEGRSDQDSTGAVGSGEDRSAHGPLPVGSGPMKVVEGSETALRLEPAREGVELDAVEIRAEGDLEGSWRAFREGEVDWAMIPASAVDDVKGEAEAMVVPHVTELWVGMNLTRPELSSPRLRSAIGFAVDRRRLVSRALPGAASLEGVIPAGVVGFDPEVCGGECDHDPERSRELLQAIGDVPSLAFDFDSTPRSRRVARAVAEDLADVGLRVELREHEPSEYRKLFATRSVQLFLLGWTGVAATPDSYLAPLFASGSVENFVGFANKGFDDGLAKARSTGDPAERAELYSKLEAAVVRFAKPVVPIAQNRTLVAVARRVRGVDIAPDGTFDVTAVRVR